MEYNKRKKQDFTAHRQTETGRQADKDKCKLTGRQRQVDRERQNAEYNKRKKDK